MKVKSEREVAQWCPTQPPHGLQPTRLLHPWDFPRKSTGVGYSIQFFIHYFSLFVSLIEISWAFYKAILPLKLFFKKNFILMTL